MRRSGWRRSRRSKSSAPASCSPPTTWKSAAGELLGEDQSGQIQEIGFTLYGELLERAVQALKAGREPELDKPLSHGTEIDLNVAALIPDDYLPDVHERLMLHKRIASATSNDELRELQGEMIHRFGLLPPQAKMLFRITELKLLATPLGITKIELGENGGRVTFTEKPNVDPMKIIRLIQVKSPEVFEEAVSVAASFACSFQTQESLLDLLFVGPESFCFTTGRGLAHADQMLEILAAVRPCRNQPFSRLQDLVLNHTELLSGCICVFLAWDDERRELVRKLKLLHIPLLVLVVLPEGKPPRPLDPGPMRDEPEHLHVLQAGRIQEGLAALST